MIVQEMLPKGIGNFRTPTASDAQPGWKGGTMALLEFSEPERCSRRS